MIFLVFCRVGGGGGGGGGGATNISLRNLIVSVSRDRKVIYI